MNNKDGGGDAREGREWESDQALTQRANHHSSEARLRELRRWHALLGLGSQGSEGFGPGPPAESPRLNGRLEA